MIAKNEIEKGTRILEDDLLFSVIERGIDRSAAEKIGESFDGLSPEQQQQFWNLHCPDLPISSPLMRRYVANRFELDPGRSGIFLKASRVNHSCRPNAFAAWNSNLCRLTLHAVGDILRGEEITVSYCTPFFPLEDRLKWLRAFYGFQCGCPACHLEIPSSQRGELRLQKMKTLDDAIYKPKDDLSNNDNKELDMIHEFINLAELTNTHGLFLSRMYRRARDLYEVKGLLGFEKLVLRYSQRALENDLRLLGSDNSVTHESMRSLEEVKAKARDMK